jgi:hypothetical protein
MSHAWQALTAVADDPGAPRPLIGPLRLNTAARILRDCGAALSVATVDEAQVVEIRLHAVETA